MPTIDNYQAPEYLKVLTGADGIETATLGKMKELLEAGKSFLEGQTAWNEIPRAYDILSGDSPGKLAGYSTLSINRIKMNFRNLVATVANLKPTGQALTKNREMIQSVDRLNRMKSHWWTSTFADRKYRKACQWTCALGISYLEPWYDPNFYAPGRGEIAVKVRGPAAVYPVMLTEDNDLQKAYAVTIAEPIPLHIVMANYPQFASVIVPTRSFSGWMGRLWDRVRRPTAQQNGVLGVLATPQRSIGHEMPIVDVYTTYIMDPSVNNTGQDIPMGDPGTSWEYTVPFVGKQIASGLRDLRGQPILRTATAEDCRLFPLRRRVIWTDTCVLKDGSSPYLHGRVPLVPLRFDDQPWDYLGTSIIHDTWKIQKAINQIWRAIVDSVLVRLQPPLKYDPNVIDPAAMARINTRIPGQTIQGALGMGDPVAPLLPVAFWDVPQWIIQVITMLYDELDKLSVVKDLMAVAKAKQVPSADSIEKILEAAGPVVQDICRGGEEVTSQFDQLFYPMALQFWGADKVFHVLGEDGALKESIDFDPGNIIPSHLPGEDRRQPSQFATWERTRWTIDQLSYEIEPFSQAQVSRIGRNLVLLQARKSGVTVSNHTIGKGLTINVGELPLMRSGKVAVTEFEKVEVETEMMHAMQEDMQAGQPQQGQGRGRPNSNQTPPSLKSKDGGTRSTIATSR